MPLTRRLLATVAAIALPVALVLASAGTSSTAGAETTGRSYVALGDSYAAGYGIGASTRLPVAGCAQSTQDYPHQVAATLGLTLTDVSCAGAVTANIDSTPQQTGSGTAKVQDAALSSSTDLVTVTIGGNDLGFVDIAEYCAATSAQGPLALHPEKNCKAKYDPNGQDSLKAKLANVVAPALARVLADIKLKAPKAKVIVLDYPAISTDQAGAPDPSTYPGSCFSSPLQPQSFPFTATDTVYLQQTQAEMNATIKAAAASAGAGFVETYPQSLAHSACSGTKTPWMNGITVDIAKASAATGSLHPNLAGATAMAQVLEPAIERALAGPSPVSPAAPTSEQPGPAAALVLVLAGIAVMLVVILSLWFRLSRGADAWRPR
jgi:lysophospholipase L1-like esterase